jgi:hypothetical protein
MNHPRVFIILSQSIALILSRVPTSPHSVILTYSLGSHQPNFASKTPSSALNVVQTRHVERFRCTHKRVCLNIGDNNRLSLIKWMAGCVNVLKTDVWSSGYWCVRFSFMFSILIYSLAYRATMAVSWPRSNNKQFDISGTRPDQLSQPSALLLFHLCAPFLFSATYPSTFSLNATQFEGILFPQVRGTEPEAPLALGPTAPKELVRIDRDDASHCFPPVRGLPDYPSTELATAFAQLSSVCHARRRPRPSVQ